MRNVDFARQPARLLLIAMMTAALAAPQAARPDHAVLDEIRAHHSGIAVWWVGNAGWLIKSGDLRAVRVGKSYRLAEDDVDRYLAQGFTQAG